MFTCGVDMMSIYHVWCWYPPKTTPCIHIRHLQCVWACGMLSQGHLGQVGPRFGISGSLVEWTWWHYIMFADIHLRPLYTFILNIYNMFVLGKTGQMDQVMQRTDDSELPEFQQDLVKVHVSRQWGSSRDVRAKLSLLSLYLAVQFHVLSIIKLTSSHHNEL